MRVYKICDEADWAAMRSSGSLPWSRDDVRDGFVHLSAPGQVRATAARHFAGKRGLMLLTVDEEALGSKLRWEPSRGGELFPHLHAALPLSAVLRADDLLLEESGTHRFPDDIPT